MLFLYYTSSCRSYSYESHMTLINIIKTYTNVHYAIVLENVIHRGSDPYSLNINGKII